METKMVNRNLFPTIGLAFLMLSVMGCEAPAITPTSTPIAASVPTAIIEPASPPGKMLLIYDDDGSRDGMAALLYLLSYPHISVQAINISYGEAHPKSYIQHV